MRSGAARLRLLEGRMLAHHRGAAARDFPTWTSKWRSLSGGIRAEPFRANASR